MVEQQRQKLMSGTGQGRSRPRRPPPMRWRERRHARIARSAQALRAAQGAVADEREARARTEARLEGARVRRSEEGAQDPRCARLRAGRLPGAGPAGAGRPAARVSRMPTAQLLRLKADRERLGGVNLQADEDLTGLSEQFEGMNKEKTDVEAAIAKLRAGIAQINNEGQSRLQAAFDAVDAHFRNLFTTLFGGGEARLEMIEARGPAGGGPRDHRQAARQEAGHAVPAVGRRAVADRHGADLRRVPHQPVADLRARRGGRAARRRQRRPLLHAAGEDVAPTRPRASSSSRITP